MFRKFAADSDAGFTGIFTDAEREEITDFADKSLRAQETGDQEAPFVRRGYQGRDGAAVYRQFDRLFNRQIVRYLAYGVIFVAQHHKWSTPEGRAVFVSL